MQEADLLPVQRTYIEAHRAGRTTASTDAARACDKASHAELNKLRASGANATCFDCDALRPGWAALPHGVFVCIDCAQVHRSLGRHITQTKAINTGTYLWFPHEIAVMREVGNAVAAKMHPGAPKPSRDASAETKAAIAHDKYVRGRWRVAVAPGDGAVAAASAPPTAQPPPAFAPQPTTARGGRQAPATRGTNALKARRTPPTGNTEVADLISWADDEGDAQPSAPTAAAAEAGTAHLDQTTAPAAEVDVSGYEAKKASVLARFGRFKVPGSPFHRGGGVAGHCGAGAGLNAASMQAQNGAFFAQYGL